jgi:lipoprotein-anchoring transpeptidase ErfK/SrfK
MALLAPTVRDSARLRLSKPQGLAVRARILGCVIILAGTVVAAAGAFANSPIDPDGRFDGGKPSRGPYSGASPVARTTVSFAGDYTPGTIVISTAERRLYLVVGNGQAIRYGIGVGRPGFTWSGVKRITAKREWPDWTPPEAMLRRRPDLPRHMKGGIQNPLGARAMYLGSSEYRIHGSNEPETIGTAVSSGCFRLTNEDVIDLYGRVKVGATVIIRQQ